MTLSSARCDSGDTYTYISFRSKLKFGLTGKIAVALSLVLRGWKKQSSQPMVKGPKSDEHEPQINMDHNQKAKVFGPILCSNPIWMPATDS